MDFWSKQYLLMWIQQYAPTGWLPFDTFLAALPILLLLGLLASGRVSAHVAALVGLVTAFVIAVFVYVPAMPGVTGYWDGVARWAPAMVAAAGNGAIFGLVPIGWIVFAAIFLYSLTVEAGQFEIVKHSVASLSDDRRIQALLIAFSFGAFVEGAAGFGTPVAISAALMMGAGFRPLYAAGLALLANTSPVAFGALGTPILTLGEVTGLDVLDLSRMTGRQLPFFSLMIPVWLVWVMSGWRGVVGVWPALLICGGSFAAVQFLVSNFHGPWLVDVAGGLVSLIALSVFLRFWQPRETWHFPDEATARAAELNAAAPGEKPKYTTAQIVSAWIPWVLLSAFVFLWGVPQVKQTLGSPSKSYMASFEIEPQAIAAQPTLISVKIPLLNRTIARNPRVIPVEQTPAAVAATTIGNLSTPAGFAPLVTASTLYPGRIHVEPAVYHFNWLSTTGTSIFLAAIVSAFWLRIPPGRFIQVFLKTLHRVRFALFTIACMLALAFITRYSGMDSSLGIAFKEVTQGLYPVVAAFIGWLGVALTGSDTSSNALFGSLQTITAGQLASEGILPLDVAQAKILLASANSTGGVMGKMIDAQSIVVASAATQQTGQEGAILRFVFLHSLALALLMGLLVLFQAYVWTSVIP